MTDRGDATAKTVLAEGIAAADSASVDVVVRPVIAGRYEVLGLIGAGAMGTVYRARDRELDEVIALKVLKKELAGTSGMLERFRREVKLARRVTHRNVARVFDIGEDGGDRFLTMELVEGESLARRLFHFGRLPLREVVAITRDVCEGLAVAHEAGVLHRDLKPDNVIVSNDGRAVITDFGIARAVAEGEAKTAVGSFIGTPLYMAPEQVEGVLELDARADLYALGAMLYELITGEPAWQRPSVVAVAAARLLSPPPDPRLKVPDLPEDVAALVLRLMARAREERPKAASEVVAALASHESVLAVPRTSEAPRVDGRKKRIAVLPLEAAEDDSWLAFGVVEELTTLFGRSEGITLRSTPGVRRSQDREGREAGRILDVDAVVTGTVRRHGDKVRVLLRLVTVGDGFQLWAQTFSRPLSEIGVVADEAATAIADALSTRAVIPPRAVVNTEVEERFLKGRYLLFRGVGAFRDQSVSILREAYELAPDDARIAGGYALALARAYRADIDSRFGDEARKIARRALELDSTRPEGRVALGTIHLADGDGEKAAVEIASALRVAPNAVDALDTMGRVLAEAGATGEGIRLIDIALSKEDIAIARTVRIRTLVLLGPTVEQADRLREWMAELPSDSGGFLASALLWLRFLVWSREEDTARECARALLQIGLTAEVLASISSIVEHPHAPASRRVVHDLLHRALASMPHRAARGRALRGQLAAEAALFVGDEETAIAALQAADDDKLFDLLWLDRCPTLDPIRERPELVRVRANVAARAQAIVAAYERAKIAPRLRG